MIFNKKQIKDIISQEIEWHKNNTNEINMPDDWISGFIAGLKHLKKLFTNIK